VQARRGEATRAARQSLYLRVQSREPLAQFAHSLMTLVPFVAGPMHQRVCRKERVERWRRGPRDDSARHRHVVAGAQVIRPDPFQTAVAKDWEQVIAGGANAAGGSRDPV